MAPREVIVGRISGRAALSLSGTPTAAGTPTWQPTHRALSELCVCVCIHEPLCVYTHVCVSTHVCIYMCTCVYSCVCSCGFMCAYVNVCGCGGCVCTHVHICIAVCAHVGLCVCMCTCMWLCVLRGRVIGRWAKHIGDHRRKLSALW